MRHPYKIILLLVLFFLQACSEEYLNKKPDKSLVVPTTLDDFQALLDNGDQVMNVTPGLGLIASDDAFTNNDTFLSWSQATQRGAYIWATNVYNGETVLDWNIPYQQIFYCNVVLDGLASIKTTSDNLQQWNEIHASALYYKANAYFELAQIFASPYEEAKAKTALGVPMKSSSDIKAATTRPTLSDNYQTMIEYFTEASAVLPETQSFKTRPSGLAAKAMLAKIYLLMGDFDKAKAAAGDVLSGSISLMDYNVIDTTLYYSFNLFNDETIFYSNMTTYSYTFMSTTYVDTTLFASFDQDDLRRSVFFRNEAPNRYSFKGSYASYNGAFSGTAVDEVYLVSAESKARTGDLTGARADLNTLLEKRYVTGKFISVTENDPDTLLIIILKERQKELVMRNTRWSDLRRLNKDARFSKALSRTLAAETYSLQANDLRYTFPIPDNEISASGIAQNPR